MSKATRKGQGAMEYLMTYGWAILVVGVVGVALWQLGIFSGQGRMVTVSGFSKIKPWNRASPYRNNALFSPFSSMVPVIP